MNSNLTYKSGTTLKTNLIKVVHRVNICPLLQQSAIKPKRHTIVPIVADGQVMPHVIFVPIRVCQINLVIHTPPVVPSTSAFVDGGPT